MKKYAIIIAVEQYSDPNIDDVAYARRDAVEFSNALELHGFDKAGQLILIDNQATKGVIESRVRKVIKRLQKGDVLYFYYAGHGFSKGAKNFLTCHDTLDADWDGTSVSLAPIFSEMQASDCDRIAFFLDCCESGIKATSGLRGIYDNLKEHELEEFLDAAKHCVCFAACRSDESSYSSMHLQHGIWTYHIIEAFRGDAPLALERGMLTGNSLQNYLKGEVPRTLNKAYTTKHDQTPWMYGALSGDFLLADLRPVLEERREKASKGSNVMAELLFKIEESEGLKSLSGWKKSYRVPDGYSDTTRLFAAGCGSDDLKTDLDATYDKLRKAFGFARRDLDVSEPGDGTGTIVTPYFNYSVSLELNPDELGEVVWTKTVDAIKAPDQITCAAFAEVFDDVFDTLEFSLPNWLEIDDFIDAVEAAKIPDLTITYDREATYCELQITGAVGTITLTSHSLSICHDRPEDTQLLIESFVTARKLIQKHGVPLISFTPKKKLPPP
ncbi:caspase family protein [Bremerella cremea]|uniref:caspase family protein n=1 Tax=Bremerella cremea TaxID=1031537 RepID=UPI0031EB1537